MYRALSSSIPVHEGEAVTKGQILFVLDPQKFQIALDNARANLAQVRLNIQSAKADYQAALRDTAAKQQQVNADQATYDRYASLVKQRAVTQQETDDARYKLAADQQAVRASESQARALLAKLDGNPDIAVGDMPSFKQAQAQVAEAEREMNHSIVRAPYERDRYSSEQAAARHVSGCQHGGVRPGVHRSCLGGGGAEGNPVDLCQERRSGRCQLRHLSRAHLERHRAERGAGDRSEFLPVAGREFVRQLGEGGAAHSGSGSARHASRAIRRCARA